MSKNWREVSNWDFPDLSPDEELFQAARYNDIDRVKELIEMGANVNVMEADDGTPDDTPLIAAAARGHIDTVKILIEEGADVNYIDGDGNTALIHITFDGIDKGKIAITKLLLDAGANVSLKNKYGLTAEMYVSGISSQNKETDNDYKEMTNLLREARERQEKI